MQLRQYQEGHIIWFYTKGGGGGGGVLWIFMRGNFSSYICFSLKKRFICPLDLNANI